ncbi:MAG: hypothetical protein HY688_00435 [Chloroflexi bacterium]|nr:hypothetical protein [Chloroflexota bacterium]
MVNSPGDERTFQILMAEYSALREEIKYRTQFQQGILAAELAALAALLVVARSTPEFLLAIAYISAVLGLYYFDHHANIMSCGRYIGEHLRQMAIELGAQEAFAKEGNVEYGPGRRWRIAFPLVVGSLFVLPGVLAIVLTIGFVQPKVLRRELFLALVSLASPIVLVCFLVWLWEFGSGPFRRLLPVFGNLAGIARLRAP